MKITKFAQSCIMIETNNTKILVDPGTLSSEKEIEQMTNVDFVFVTHRHGDHFSQDLFDKIKKESTIIYSTNEVASVFTNTNFKIIKEEDNLELSFGKVEVVKAVHGYLPHLTAKGAEINENVGYILEIEDKKLYFVSDSICFKNDYTADALFVPICNHGLVMGPFDAGQFAKKINPKLVIPIHNDNPSYTTDLNKVKEEFNKVELNYKILEIGQSVDF